MNHQRSHETSITGHGARGVASVPVVAADSAAASVAIGSGARVGSGEVAASGTPVVACLRDARPPVVGMVGAGQLARMTAAAAIGLGIRFRALAAAPDESAAQVTADTVLGDYRL